jgi:hypothetical protein
MFVIMPVKSHPLLRRVRVLPRKTKDGSWAYFVSDFVACWKPKYMG